MFCIGIMHRNYLCTTFLESIMNIFILDKDPKTAAEYHCDKHVLKMILETAQMLCTAHWETGGQAPYRATHKNHPCTKWT